jgi:hypothetical protein
MSSTLASILVNIDVAPGASAIDYTAPSGICPVLGFNCVGSSGSGNVKVTPYSATTLVIGEGLTAGANGRLRITTGGAGNITAVEIASGGTGYPSGAIPVRLVDPFGTGGVISLTASGGALTAASVTTAGINYSGYFLFDVNDFIEGVTYNIVPRFIEQTSGSGVLRLVGYKLGYRPFQSF